MALKRYWKLKEFTAVGPNGEAMQGSCEVSDMRRGWPSKPQLLEGAIAALRAKFPGITSPPWLRIVDSKRGVWGPPESPGMSVIFSAPYVGAMNQIAVELNWANGKNHVGNAMNQRQNRTSAQVINMRREPWFGTGATNVAF